jgi:hypothetical protein
VDFADAWLCLDTWDAAVTTARGPEAWFAVAETAGYRAMLEFSRADPGDWAAGMNRAVAWVRAGETAPAVSGEAEMIAWRTARLLGETTDARARLAEVEKNMDRQLAEALKRAERYLPRSAHFEAEVHFVFGGCFDACRPRAVLVNLVYFLREPRHLTKILGHELHHVGFGLEGVPHIDNAAGFVAAVVSEGLAMQTMMPLGPGDAEYFLQYWQRHDGKLAQYASEFAGILAGRETGCPLGSQDFDERWLSNVGPAYYLGQRMAQAIEEREGHDRLIELVEAGPNALARAWLAGYAGELMADHNTAPA